MAGERVRALYDAYVVCRVDRHAGHPGGCAEHAANQRNPLIALDL